MILEWCLAILHVSAFLGLIVFLSGQISLCRTSWWHESMVPRLQRLNVFYWGSAVTVLLSGLARVIFGVKGWAFYAGQPIFWFKLVAFIVVTGMSLRVNRAYRVWAVNAKTCPPDVDALRRWMMIQAHLIMVFPILGLMMAYGILPI